MASRGGGYHVLKCSKFSQFFCFFVFDVVVVVLIYAVYVYFVKCSGNKTNQPKMTDKQINRKEYQSAKAVLLIFQICLVTLTHWQPFWMQEKSNHLG